MATVTNIGFDRGEDITIKVTVAGDGDISGWTLQCDIKSPGGGSAVISKTVGNGITITDGANRKFEIALADTDTDKLVGPTYQWGVKRTNAGQEAGLAKGLITVGDSVAV